MKLFRVVLVLVAMLALAHAEEADPCLAEDYAEANCALASPLTLHRGREAASSA